VPLLAPAAEALGINLIWFGVLLGANMQTSFMHPPFGFALFYLRGIADTLFKNKSLPAKVESRDIYMGAIPWVFMQLILVVVVIFVPETVTAFLDKEKVVDMDKATQQLEGMGGSRRGDGGAASAPSIEVPAPDAPASAPAAGASEPDDAMEAVRRALESDKKP
jgi:hypothetical protein